MHSYKCVVCKEPFEAQRRRRAAPTCSSKCRWTASRREAGQTPRREYETTGRKHCPDCKQTKPVDQFTVRTDRGTPIAYCKPCMNVRSREWIKTPAGRASYYARKYNVTLEWVEETLERQSNLCAICQRDRKLHLDHDHVTGRARGFLCQPCNVGIGHFEDSPAMLSSAIDYLYKRNK